MADFFDLTSFSKNYFFSNGWAGFRDNVDGYKFTKTSSTWTINGVELDLYTCTVSTTSKSNVKDGIGKMKNGKLVRLKNPSPWYTEQHKYFYDSSYNEALKPTKADGTSPTKVPVYMHVVGWVKLTYMGTDYFYAFCNENYQKVSIISSTSNPTTISEHFQPYEPIYKELSVSYSGKTIPFGTAGNATSNQWTNFSGSLTKTLDTTKISPRTYKTSVTYEGDVVYTWYYTVDDWANKSYEIVATGGDYDIYAGKTVGNDFLSAFKVKYTRSNEYNSITTYPKTSLELEKMSATTFSETDNTFDFDYDISDISQISTTSISVSITSGLHYLASGSNKFANFNRPKSFDVGDVVGDIDFESAGSLTYDDGTTISFEDVEFNTGKDLEITSNLEYILPHTVTLTTPASFTVTYKMDLKHFGELSITDNCIKSETSIANYAQLEDYKVQFHPDDLVDYGSISKIKFYNEDDEVIQTVDREDFNEVLQTVPSAYNTYASEYLCDEIINLKSIALGCEIQQNIVFEYDEPILELDISSVTKEYIFDPEDEDFNEYDFDYTGLVIKAKRHTNTIINGVVNTSITDVSINVTDVTISHDDLDTFEGKSYQVTVTYKNSWNQTLTGTFSVYAEPLKPVEIIYSDETVGGSASRHYYDNDNDVFKLPTGLSFTIVFNDPIHNATVSSDYGDSFEFYRGSQKLTAGTSSIVRNQSAGNTIRVYSPEYNVEGFYDIIWDEDRVVSIALASGTSVTCFLGNRLNKASVKSQIELTCTHASGRTSTVDDPDTFRFKNASIILTAPTSPLVVEIDELGEFELALTNFTFSNPYGKLKLNMGNFPDEYNNNVDIIYLDRIQATMEYYEDALFANKCDYEQTLTYSSTGVNDSTQFTVGVGTDDILENYGFGSAVLTISMGLDTVKTSNLVITGKNKFSNATVTYDHDPSTAGNQGYPINIIEITNITGLKIISAKSEYFLDEEFLNEDDNTEILIYYKDTNDTTRTYRCLLRNSLTAINIYPLKGTKFNKVNANRTITISSANDYNVKAEYAINIKARYVYDKTETMSAVALWIDNYVCPDGVERSKYFLVDRVAVVNGNSYEATDIDGTTEERVIRSGLLKTDLTVYGYLDDINDPSKNARVILFDDYISPIEGQNNITIKFPCYVEGNADLINKCHFGIMFGNNNSKNRLFLSGNPEHPNYDWHSGEVDYEHTDDETMVTGNYGYFEDLSECVYGETDNAVVGYDIVANDKLLVLKNHSDKETTVYFRQPQLVTAINGSGTAVTGLDDETLYQEEFSLTKGNNSVAGINPKAILNFNGDSLFISKDKQIVGLDLTGIVGDNQRYANTRSRAIDEDLKHQDLENAFLWSNNKILLVILKNKVYYTHFEAKIETQYEWFIMDVADVTSVIEIDDVIYFGNSKGELHKFVNEYDDIFKVFAGYGITKLQANEETEIFTASGYLTDLDLTKKHYFKPVPFTNNLADDDPYIYYSLGTILNNTTGDCDFYVDNDINRNSNHLIELVCRRNGKTDNNLLELTVKRISEKVPVYFNKTVSGRADIETATNMNPRPQKGIKYYLKEFMGDSRKHLYQVLDGDGNVMPMAKLYNARLCLKVDRPMEMTDINKTNGTFKLISDGVVLNIVQYSSQVMSAFRGEIIEYKKVEAYYISKPYLGNLEYLKTIWSITLTNDSNIPSELELCIANNKIPNKEDGGDHYALMKTLAQISKDVMGFDFDTFNFALVDFDKNVVPRTYTHKRVLSNVKFICFGFRNYNNSNSVLSSMSITYTVPYPSYSGD